MAGSSKVPKEGRSDDLSWSEVGVLARSYLRIPLALIFVELFYWYITQPTNTLGLLQESEAWIWYHLTEFIYGPGAATLSEYNGWNTMVTLKHTNFFGDNIYLYVSDECAGLHEMIFISVLIMMSTGVPQRLRIKSAIVACIIVYIINIARLLVLYPLAVSGCNENPNMELCEMPLHDFHTFFYQWGFLIILVLMWLVWFKWVNAGDLIRKENNRSKGKWSFIYRKMWKQQHKFILGFSILLVLGAFANVLQDDAAMKAKDDVDNCVNWALELQDSTAECYDAKEKWAQEIQTSWSLATLGLLGIICVCLDIKRPNLEEE